ncbi:MAG: MerR family transcriptional regulator [Thermomicrobiales bacterium]
MNATSDALDTPAAEHSLPGGAMSRPSDRDPDVTPGASPALRRLLLTSDLRAATGLARTHMDYYLREGIVRPVARTESGFLLFDEPELELLRAVLRWREDGVTIKEIRDRIDRPASV